MVTPGTSRTRMQHKLYDLHALVETLFHLLFLLFYTCIFSLDSANYNYIL